MLRKNIIGGILICIILFSFVGVGLYLGVSLTWQAYFKILAIVALVAIVVSTIINTVPAGSDNK